MSACFPAKVHAAQYLVPAKGECCYSLPAHLAEKLDVQRVGNWFQLKSAFTRLEVGSVGVLA